MQRRDVLVTTSGMAAAALAGCLGSGDNGNDPSDQAGTPTVEAQTDRAIVVSNAGEVTGEPDLAVLDVGVEARGESAGAVRNELSTRSEELRGALLEFGLDEDAITTSRFDIHERVDRQQMEADGVRPDSEAAAEEYTYYQGRHSFTVEVSEIDDVGAVIDTAVDGGADQVGHVTFTLSDERRAELREQALQRAIKGGRSEAETIADEIGSSVVEATVIDASDGQVSPVRREVAYAGDAATEAPQATPTTTIESGEVTVRAQVRIEFAME